MSEKQDVLMKDAEDVSSHNDSVDAIVKEIEASFVLLSKAASSFDNRYVSKVFRDLGPLRRKLVTNKSVLPLVINRLYPSAHGNKLYLLKALDATETDERMDVDEKEEAVASANASTPEVELYLHLLVQVSLLDQNELEKVNALNDNIIQLMKLYNRRSLDFIQAKIWFFISRTKELLNDLLSIRSELLSSLRTATLRHDTETTASIITLLLRNYLLSHDISQASNLVEKTDFPENAGNALVARYYYYLARINAIQLDYSSAHECVIAAIRKAPQTHLANGFIQSATKLSIIIELLMGDIPELKVFKKQSGSFEAYFNVTKAVKLGDLNLFGEVLNKYEDLFKKDDNFTLVSRLRQNVIKTGIRIISLSYSKISLKDICIKLHLDSEESTEYIVSKAIRDGVIEASINHQKGYMQSKELLDVYSTKLPQNEFDQRIKFCLSLHNDSVKSMRYPSDNDNKDDASKDDSKEDEIDLLKAIEEGDLDDFMD
ncbi:proteasome regulatory subunit C-terminal-domain-containing protein [Scheffersomyces xylosifermentans]|uniref:proteasome regulatory subunit C-terminal-domain-containing protein n=1 Tax=Scheffersomyces xylosifermentans TaxID=1304137 RepID=UPI00315D5C69